MTVYSTRKSRVCCTPQPAKGSPRFVRAASPCHPKAARFVGLLSPRRISHPPKISPRQQPYRITAAVAFLPLPSCPARVPTEAGVLADRRVPRRATYTRSPYRGGPSRPAPRGGGSGGRRGGPCPVGLGGPRPRGAVGSLTRRNGVARAPRSSSFPAPVRRGARLPEGCRLPCPGEARRPAPRRVPFTLPRLGGGRPGEIERAGLRRAPVARSR
jgi:hypothetical protein